MATTDPYIQFPLCLLSMRGKRRDFMNSIILYGLTEAGYSVLEMTDEKGVDKLREEYAATCDEDDTIEFDDIDDESLRLAVYAGTKICQIDIQSYEAVEECYYEVKEHVDDWEGLHGSSPLVRIKLHLCYMVRDSKGFSLRELRVLAAIYSVIGSKTYPVAIPLRMIVARATGCKNEAVLGEASVDHDWDPTHVLTTKQVRSTVTRLHELRWFSRITPNPRGRVTYYQHLSRFTEDGIRAYLLRKHTPSATPTLADTEREKNAAFLQQLRLLKATQKAIAGQRKGNVKAS
jgi:hypothetical protein